MSNVQLKAKVKSGKAEVLKPCVHSVNGLCQNGSCSGECCKEQIVDEENNNTMPCDGVSYECQ